MCGIVGGISFQDIGPILLQGLKRLEYRGYDSAGLALLTTNHRLKTLRVMGKVKELEQEFIKNPIASSCGIAHTRWATHGIPSKENAHPHTSHQQVAAVHNGIIENYEYLKADLISKGYKFLSQTDSEVIVHLIHYNLQKTNDLLKAVQLAVKSLVGMYAIGVVSVTEPNCLIAARSGSPLIMGIGENENYIASDIMALLTSTQSFIYLEEGDVAKVEQKKIAIFDRNGQKVNRKIVTSKLSQNLIDIGPFHHYMEKEIFEQPDCIEASFEEHLTNDKVIDESFGVDAPRLFRQVDNVMLVACGTSYHAALIARYWLEEIAGISAQVEIASEYRYRRPVIKPNTIFIALSQSGETADTIAAFRQAKKQNYLTTLVICNVPESTLVREAELVFLTRAGPEICVASTKSFTTQLVALLMTTIALGHSKKLTAKAESNMVKKLWNLPDKINATLKIKRKISVLARKFIDKNHTLFLGRGSLYPVAMEGALKLKEITYIHAEAYPAGELKHGPLALVDNKMPVIVVAPDNDLFAKIKSNLQEVKARGGKLIVFADANTNLQKKSDIQIIKLPSIDWFLAPILYVIPLQLLAYYVGILRGTDVDQPRNLAKSVTVE